MSDDYNPYYQEPNMSNETRVFAEQIIIWMLNKQTFYPEDIINMMIDSNLMTPTQFKTLKEILATKNITPRIPTNHI